MVSLFSVEVSLKLLNVIFTPPDPVLQRRCEFLLLKILSLPLLVSCERKTHTHTYTRTPCILLTSILSPGQEKCLHKLAIGCQRWKNKHWTQLMQVYTQGTVYLSVTVVQNL